MTKFLTASITLLCALSYGADLFVFWTNGDNDVSNLQTVVSYGLSPGSYSWSTNVPFSQTNVWLTGLTGNQRYYVAAYHTDGITNSVFSNEANAKTKMQPPKNTGASSP